MVVARTASADMATVLTRTTTGRLTMMKTGKSVGLVCSLVSLEPVELPQDVCIRCTHSAERADKGAAIAVAMATMRTMR